MKILNIILISFFFFLVLNTSTQQIFKNTISVTIDDNDRFGG
ncbi:hypothetical protein [Tenacibaculum aestuariivivum]